MHTIYINVNGRWRILRNIGYDTYWAIRDLCEQCGIEYKT